MKRIISALLAVAVAMVSLQGCYGKMALTRKVYGVNSEVKDKYLRTLVSWVFVIAPVYMASVLADFILFNTIEFWSGDNPIAAGEKEFHYAGNGETYQIRARKSGDTLTYRISHYRGDTYLNTLTINWDIRNNHSYATLHQGSDVTPFQARVQNAGESTPAVGPAKVL